MFYDLRAVWDTFILFLIPFGVGIPTGIVLGAEKGLAWPTLCFLYFTSDLILACYFEPIMHWFRKSKVFTRLNPEQRRRMREVIVRLGNNPSPFSLILFTFGTDPMTGRITSFIFGHGFFTGWAIAIAGDMIFFVVVMASTLWLNNQVGDPKIAAFVVTLLIVGIPMLIRARRNQ